MKHAALNGNVVAEVVDIDNDQQLQALFAQYIIVLNVEDVIPIPEVGWIYENGEFNPPNIGNMDQLELLRFQQKISRQFGTSIASRLIDEIGVRIRLIDDPNNPINLLEVTSHLNGLKALLEYGALDDCVVLLGQVAAGMPFIADIIQAAVDDLSEFIQKYGLPTE